MDLDPTAEAAIRTCPACGGAIHGTPHATGGTTPPLRSIPATDDPGLCVTCGTLLMWAGSAWRLATDTERTSMVDVDIVANALMIHREYVAWRDADLERLRLICRTYLAVMSGSTFASIPELSDAMATALTDAGFHTHRLG